MVDSDWSSADASSFGACGLGVASAAMHGLFSAIFMKSGGEVALLLGLGGSGTFVT
jgi:hypothetical protein